MKHLGDEMLGRLALDEVEGEQRLEWERHVRGCARCRRRLEAERRLDECLLSSIPPTPEGSAERALARLWAQVETEASESRVSRAVRQSTGRRAMLRTGSPWLATLGLAAAVLLLVFWPDTEPRDAPRPDTQGGDRIGARSSVRPPSDPRVAGSAAEEGDPLGTIPGQAASPAPALPGAVIPGAPMDVLRLAAVRAEVGDLLLAEAHPLSGPEDDGRQQIEQARDGLVRLRRAGWPVDALIRSHALGPDAVLATAAIAQSTEQPSTLAAVLADGHHDAQVLGVVEADPTLLERSLSLLRSVERRAIDGGDRCLGLLVLASGARARRALTRVLQERLSAVLAGPEEQAEPRLERLAEMLPVPDALQLLLGAAARPSLRAVLAPIFARSVARDRPTAVEVLGRALLEQHPTPPIASWIVEARLTELTPVVLALLEPDGEQPAWLAVLGEVGGPEAADALYDLWLADQGRGSAPELPPLEHLLRDDPSARQALVARLASAESQKALDLAQDLSPALAGGLLLDVLRARPEDADPEGQAAALLVGLARLGSRDLAADLIRWLTSDPGHAGLQPLGWTVATRLDPLLAGQAWARAGHDAERLSRVARAARRSLDRNRTPTAGVLQPLGRALASPGTLP